MPADLRTLLTNKGLGLRLLSASAQLAPGALQRSVPWIHSSDLADPTPFLSEGHVLLTTGTQFASSAPETAEVRAYVARLADRGLAGLGFGTEVVREGVPETLIDACNEHGLPLFEVPYRTPFIAVVQANAEELTRAATARTMWALSAQRAITKAALRPDGLSATLAELSRQLGCWVGLYDAAGTLVRQFPPGSADAADLPAVQAEVLHLLRRGQRASASVMVASRRYTVQTLGVQGRPSGALGIGHTEALDQAGHEVVTSVTALAGLALEQNRDLEHARALLRSGLLQLLQSGETELARDISSQLWGPLPEEPIRVSAVHVPAEESDALIDLLELWAQDHQGQLFFGQQDDVVLLCTRADDLDPLDPLDPLDRLTKRFRLYAGRSDAADYASFAHAQEQALQSLARCREGEPGIVEFDAIARSGVLAYLARTDAQVIAQAALAPLLAHDRERGTRLVDTTRSWLENDCEYDATARALGVHRHTVRARIDTAAQLLGRDLNTFSARADLWAAFIALGHHTVSKW